MGLIERTRISTADPVDHQALADHMRIDDGEVVHAMRYARSAADEIEQYANLALLTQEIVATFAPNDAAHILPCLARPSLMPLVGPVDAATIPTVELIEADGSATAMATGWRLQPGRFPELIFETAPTQTVRVTYTAGFGADNDAIPHDLTHAILDQALRLYDLRGDMDKPATLAPSTARIAARYRRLSAGAA